MTDELNKRAKAIQAAIREVLYREWDPIEVRNEGLKNEYDHYIGPVYRVLCSMPTREAVMRELQKIAQEKMGVPGPNEEALYRVADQLLAIDLRLNP